MDLLVYKTFFNIKCVIFDLDGTLYLGDKLIDGANELITAVRKQNKQILFVTNNSAKTRVQIYERLKTMELDVQLDEVMNSCYAVAKYLKDNDYSQIYCLGTKDFEDEISNMGIDAKSKMPEAIVIGYDPEFNYNKLEEAIGVFHKDCKIFAANKERTYPRHNGIITPGTGPAVKAFEHAVNKETELLIGKPSTFMLELITKGSGLNPDEILIIGDTYESDIAMANSFGSSSILIWNKEDRDFDNCTVVKDLYELRTLIED